MTFCSCTRTGEESPHVIPFGISSTKMLVPVDTYSLFSSPSRTLLSENRVQGVLPVLLTCTNASAVTTEGQYLPFPGTLFSSEMQPHLMTLTTDREPLHG